jgi:hypothetical protein
MVFNRDSWEEKLARILARLSSSQRRQITDLLGDPPQLDKLDSQFWDSISGDWREQLQPELERVFIDMAAEFLGGQTIGVDWALMNKAASDWARAYTFDLVKGIQANTRLALQSKVGAWFETPTTLGSLRDSLEPLFGPVRSEMIAITEITRAATMGEAAAVNLLAEQGVNMEAVWHTSNDEIVCPLCGPANGKSETDAIRADPYYGATWKDLYPYGPPAHPRCRCVLGHEFVKGKR